MSTTLSLSDLFRRFSKSGPSTSGGSTSSTPPAPKPSKPSRSRLPVSVSRLFDIYLRSKPCPDPERFRKAFTRSFLVRRRSLKRLLLDEEISKLLSAVEKQISSVVSRPEQPTPTIIDPGPDPRIDYLSSRLLRLEYDVALIHDHIEEPKAPCSENRSDHPSYNLTTVLDSLFLQESFRSGPNVKFLFRYTANLKFPFTQGKVHQLFWFLQSDTRFDHPSSRSCDVCFDRRTSHLLDKWPDLYDCLERLNLLSLVRNDAFWITWLRKSAFHGPVPPFHQLSLITEFSKSWYYSRNEQTGSAVSFANLSYSNRPPMPLPPVAHRPTPVPQPPPASKPECLHIHAGRIPEFRRVICLDCFEYFNLSERQYYRNRVLDLPAFTPSGDPNPDDSESTDTETEL
jgi:hypothetical protein